MTTVTGVEEGTQEVIQGVGTNLIYKFNDISDLKAIDIINNARNDFLFAFLSGGMAGAVTSNFQYDRIVKDTKDKLLALKDSKGQNLYTKEQAEKVAKETASLAMSNEIIDEIIGISRNERDNSLSREARNPKEMKRIIEENLKKMETALPEIKKQMLDIKDKVKENFSGLGLDKEQLDMIAEMTQARAMMYYNAFGITPLQFYYLNELEITVDENSNILSNGRETGYTVRFNEEKVSQAISSGNISNIIQSIRTKENLDKFGDFVNKLVNEGRLTQEQRSMIYSQLADRMNEIPTVAQVVDRVREEEVDKLTNNKKETIIASGGINDETYQPTNEFRRLQEESKRISNEVSWRERSQLLNDELRQRIILSLSKELQSRSNFSGNNFRFDIKAKTPFGTTFNLSNNIDGQTFRDMFEIARTFTTNGELVDLHTVEEYNTYTNYLSEDGLSGFSITPEGDLVSVFNARDVSGKKGFLYAIAPIVKEKARTLDCYNSTKQPLMKMYSEVFGFKPVAYMDYNMAYDHDNIALNHENPQVYFMANTNKDVKLKKFDDWDKTKAYQLEAVNSNQDVFNQSAYHGTPHRFEEFSTEKIGTGEGAQAHGWGLYFAENKDVSERYRRLLTSGNDVDFTSNKPISQEQKEYLKDLIDWTNVDNSNKDWYLKQLKNEIKYMQDMFTKTLNNAEQDKQTQTYLLNKLKEFDGEIEQFINALTNEELSMKVVFYGKLISVKDFFKQIIGAYPTKQDIIQMCNNQIDSDNMQTKKAKEILNLLKDIDLDSLSVQTKKSGQLFQVDIPENDVLLDEDKTFDEQPEKVKENLKKLFKSEEFKNEIFGYIQNETDNDYLKILKKYYDAVVTNFNIDKQNEISKELTKFEQEHPYMFDEIENRDIENEPVSIIETIGQIVGNDTELTGKEIYGLLTKINTLSQKGASLLLNKYGIKGITYDGRQDGRAYVIFDDKAIKILEKYYQSEINKTIEQDLKNLGYTKDVYFEDREDKIDDKDVTKIQDFKDIVDSDKDVSFSISLGQTPKKLVESGAKQRELFVSKEIINKSQNKKNIGHDLDKEILKQVPEKLYNPIAVMKSRTVDNSLVVITELNDKKNNPVIIAIKLDNKGRNNNIINEIKTIHGRSGFENLFGHSLFEKKVAKIDIKKAKSLPTNYRAVLAQRVANSSNWILAQNNGNVNTDNPRGATTVFDRQYWIELYSSADKSTLLHESTHAFLSEVLYLANGKNPSPKILSIKKQLDDWLGVPENNGRYSTRQQELFAKSSETYFREGKAPTAKLKIVFERFRKWLANIYDSIKDDLPKINDDVRELFDTILSRSYDVPDSNIYAGKEKAIKEVIKNINEGRASEVDGITIDDVYNLLNVAYVRKPSKPTKNLKQLLNEKNIYDFNELNKAGADTVFRILKDGGYIKEDATAENAGT